MARIRKGHFSPVILNSRSLEEDSEIVYNRSNGAVTLSNDYGKCRLSLTGTAILQRENEPVLSATYHYWTDQASHFFHESVQDFQRIELSKVAFGVSAYNERDSKQKLNDGVIVQSAGSKKAISSPYTHSDYMWAQVADGTTSRKWLSACNTFVIGFASCMVFVVAFYFLIL